MKKSVLCLKEKTTTQNWYLYLQIGRKCIHYSMTDPLNIMF